MYRTILFDLDGTLLDTLDDLTDAVNHVLPDFGGPIRSREEVRAFVGNGVRKLIERALGAQADDPRTEPAYRAFAAYYTAHCNERTRPYPGSPALLSALREKGVRVGVVSNKNDAAVKVLCRAHFGGTVEVALGGRDELPKKPAPDLVYEALRMLGETRDGLLYVGDSDVDKRLAENVPCDCALVSWGFRERALLERQHAKYLLDDARAIAALVGPPCVLPAFTV